MKARMQFLLYFFLLLIAEILIGTFLKGGFVRAYGGDILILPLLYCLLRSIFPKDNRWTVRWLPAGLLALGICMEGLQALHIADLLGVQNRVLRIIIGSTADLYDVLCYVLGTALIYLFQWLIYHVFLDK